MLQQYYEEIHNNLGLLTIFPGERYYTKASSSSVATALITGTPMIVDDQFLQVYSFIPAAAVMISDSSSHVVAVRQMLRLTENEWTEMSSAVSINAVKTMC